MTDVTIAQTGPVLVAIDIAKAHHKVLIAVPGRKRRRRLAVHPPRLMHKHCEQPEPKLAVYSNGQSPAPLSEHWQAKLAHRC